MVGDALGHTVRRMVGRGIGRRHHPVVEMARVELVEDRARWRRARTIARGRRQTGGLRHVPVLVDADLPVHLLVGTRCLLGSEVLINFLVVVDHGALLGVLVRRAVGREHGSEI
eukprot:346978-Rhodomonas_salina.1